MMEWFLIRNGKILNKHIGGAQPIPLNGGYNWMKWYPKMKSYKVGIESRLNNYK